MSDASQLSAAWWEQQIAEQQKVVERAMAALTATDLYQQYTQELGALNWLKRQQAFAQGKQEK